jgi:hypothetical protein
VDYADHGWVGQIGVTYGAARGGGAEAAFEFLKTGVLRGEKEVPAQANVLNTYASRLRLNLRWQFSQASSLMFGYRFHILDRWTVGRIFDGIQARVILHW